jgi:hypothetical protein
VAVEVELGLHLETRIFEGVDDAPVSRLSLSGSDAVAFALHD